MDEPTRGIDVGAKHEIFENNDQILAKAGQGNHHDILRNGRTARNVRSEYISCVTVNSPVRLNQKKHENDSGKCS
jgi:hypothetical protein